jgi:PTH1 family peptidyl-tRNA hydrolase
VSSNKAIVVGLGNPGSVYDGTRHNVGFDVLDEVASQRSLRFRRDRWLRSLSWVATDGDLLLAKPKTFMNRSGLAVRSLLVRNPIPMDRLIAVYDDADLPLGTLRLRLGGGHGGHNGVRSMIDQLGSIDFGRVRLGVAGRGRRDRGLADYLLNQFDEAERGVVQRMIALAREAVDCAIESGMPHAMNKFNGRSAAAVSAGNA